jgi:c-di-GMP-binding flagellar brake protein YcgR
MTWEGMNRRKFPRANFPCLIKILDDKKAGEVILTHTENISVGGAGAIIKRSISLFEEVGLEIDLMDGGDLVVCKAKVVWSVRRKALEEHKPFYYDLGFEFLDIKDEPRGRIGRAVEHLVRFGRGTPIK